MNWNIVTWTTLNLPEPNIKFAKGCAVQWFEQVWMRRTTPNFFPCAVTGSEALWNQPVLIVPSVVQWFEKVRIIGYSRSSLYSAVVQGLVQFEPPWTNVNPPKDLLEIIHQGSSILLNLFEPQSELWQF